MRGNQSHRRAPPALPPGAQQPMIPVSPYVWPVPHTSPPDPWAPPLHQPPPQISRPRVLSMQGHTHPRPRSAGNEHDSLGLAFPQPNVHRASSHKTGRHHRNDYPPLRLDPNHSPSNANFSQVSFASYNSNDYGNEVGQHLPCGRQCIN